MKKIMVLALGIFLQVGSVVFSATPEEGLAQFVAGATVMDTYVKEKNFSSARIEGAKILASDISIHFKAIAQHRIALTWQGEKNYTEALKAYEVIVATVDYPVDNKATALDCKAWIYRGCLNENEKALVEYNRALALPKVSPAIRACAFESTGDLLTQMERVAEAQEMYLRTAIKGASYTQIKGALSKIDPMLVTPEKYLAFLNSALLCVEVSIEESVSEDPAIMEVVKAKLDLISNIKFILGKLK